MISILFEHKKKQMKKAEAVRKEGHDKFYTLPSVSRQCLFKIGQMYDWDEWDLVIEPSAGNGSFFLQIPSPKRIGMDILPEHPDILTMDFFSYTPPKGNILVVGNPPFGRVSSLAVRFFNHAAGWASVIAFIVPRTFRRVSIHNKLNPNFHCMLDEDIPQKPCCFDPPMNVKCCFQIWEKKEVARPILQLPLSHPDWQFMPFGPKDQKNQPTPPLYADFAIRAYGGKCGEIVNQDLESLRPKSWHWIKSNIDQQVLIERFRSLDYSICLDTARQNSIGRGELVRLYTDAFP